MMLIYLFVFLARKFLFYTLALVNNINDNKQRVIDADQIY